MRRISDTDAKAFSDLVDRVGDEDGPYPPNGSMQVRKVKGREFVYYVGYDRGGIADPTGRFERYVGPAEAPEVLDATERFSRSKSGYLARRQLASHLRRAGLPAPTRQEGSIVAALARAGVFRSGGILVGTMAYQTFPGLLGFRLPPDGMGTADVDVARPRRVVVAPGREPIDVEAALREIDPTFAPLFRADVSSHAMGFANSTDYRVEFLTDASGRNKTAAVPMAGIPGIAAQPLPYLEFLMHDPVRSVVLHEDGVATMVPEPARYAVHKTIVAAVRGTSARGATAKVAKDVSQAGRIIDALDAAGAKVDVGVAWLDAWRRGPSWRRCLIAGAARLTTEQRIRLRDAVDFAATIQDLEKGRDFDGGLEALAPRSSP